jgi:murein DD-endopeptidase MepM/ murein hydrolase activator NlpD
MKIGATPRLSDGYGSGHYGASRGSRTHKGVDFACWAGNNILSPIAGKVTKLGYPYAKHLEFRYVEVEDPISKERHRLFYVEPCVEIGQHLLEGEVLGTSQNLLDLYPNGMTQHFHYEVIKYKGGKKEYIDPNKFLNG